MSDERFERDIRDALLADDPGAVPNRLWTRVAAIPDEAPRRGLRPMRALGLLAAAAVVIVAVSIASLGGRGVTVGPPASASAPASSSSSPAESPSTQPSPSDASGPISVAPGDVAKLPASVFAIRNGKAYTMVGTVSATPVFSISAVDVATGAATLLAKLPSGHRADSPALAADSVVWMESWYGKPPADCGLSVPCNPWAGQPVLWNVVAVPLAGGPETVLAAGSSSRTSIEGEGAAPMAPILAADGDRVAYAVDAPTNAAPEASRLIVRSTSTGAILRQIDTTGYVEQLGLSGQAIAYGEGFDIGGAGTVPWGDATLLAARTDAEAPVKLDVHVSSSVIGGGRVAWTRVDSSDYAIWTASLDTLQAVQVKGAAIPVPAGSLALSSHLVIAGQGVAWIISVQDGTGAWLPEIALWRPGDAPSSEVIGTEPDALVSGDGLLGWTSSNVPDTTLSIPLATLWGSN